MSRGKNWTEEELKDLKALQERFPDLGWTALAKVGKRLGYLPDRSTMAMKLKFIQINKPQPEPEPEPIPEPEQLEIKPEDIIDYKAMYEEVTAENVGLRAKLNKLVDDVMLGNASLNDYGTGLFLDFKSARAWLWECEPEKTRNRIEVLRKEKFGA